MIGCGGLVKRQWLAAVSSGSNTMSLTRRAIVPNCTSSVEYGGCAWQARSGPEVLKTRGGEHGFDRSIKLKLHAVNSRGVSSDCLALAKKSAIGSSARGGGGGVVTGRRGRAE